MDCPLAVNQFPGRVSEETFLNFPAKDFELRTVISYASSLRGALTQGKHLIKPLAP